MPKISLHVEADTPEEYLAIIAAIGARVVNPVEPKAARPSAQVEYEVNVTEMTAEETAEAVAQEDVVKMTAEETVDAFNQQVEEAAKKTRKPRGPNKPKMTPVTEEAPEEVEHVGTVAVDKPDVVNGEDTMNESLLTRMDLGDTIAGYVRKYGINFAQTDVSKMLQDMFGADVRKKSDVPDDQKSLRQAIATITQATIDNPYNRKVDVNG